jgi:acetyl esterase/lipase
MTGYLISMLVVAVPTLFAVFAPRTSGLERALSFRLGIVVNEAPLYPMLWVIASTALAVVDGSAYGVGGAVALALGSAALVGLGVVARRGVRARTVVARALDDAGFPAASTLVASRASWRRDAIDLLAPFAVIGRGVRRVRDVPYAGHGRRSRLDVYLPASRSKPQREGDPHEERSIRPVLVYFHGGGYSSGGKSREARLLLARMARRGLVCVSANYRLRPEVGFEGHLSDARAVLAWVRAHAAEYGGDPSRVALAGSSAGAHLASIVALSSDTGRGGAAPDGTLPVVSGVVCLYGWFGRYWGERSTDRPSSDPVDLVSVEAPPFVVAHCTHDTVVPLANARRFVGELRRRSRRPVVFIELPHAQHGFDLFRSPRWTSIVDGLEAFLGEQVEARPVGKAGSVRDHDRVDTRQGGSDEPD